MINQFTGGIEIERDESNQKNSSNQYFELRDINEYFAPVKSNLSNSERYSLIHSVAEVNEVINDDELKALIERNPQPICYDGFEPSGRMHIAQGIFRAINVNKLTKAGCIFKFWIADWFAQMNNKMGGDMEKIRIVGRYFVEIWRAAGMDLSNVKFLWCSDEINKDPKKYWQTVIDIARHNNLDRMKRCCQIMGRNENDKLSAAQILYPCMQCADIFYLEADICQLGLDQRKVNVLCREYCDDIKRKVKPVIISHHMLSGLKKDQVKMSKSDAMSAIYMEDSVEDVEKKIKSAYCVEKEVTGNPVLEYAKYLIFQKLGKFELLKDGGSKVYEKYEDLEKEYAEGLIHPTELKPSVAKHLNEMIEPVRQHFKNDPFARKLLELVKSFQITK